MILAVLGIIGASVIIGEIAVPVKWLKTRLKLKRIKPFDCPFCLSFWFSITYAILQGYDLENFIFISGVTPILTIIVLQKVIYKL